MIVLVSPWPWQKPSDWLNILLKRLNISISSLMRMRGNNSKRQIFEGKCGGEFNFLPFPRFLSLSLCFFFKYSICVCAQLHTFLLLTHYQLNSQFSIYVFLTFRPLLPKTRVSLYMNVVSKPRGFRLPLSYCIPNFYVNSSKRWAMSSHKNWM